jgi:hypothetical protein
MLDLQEASILNQVMVINDMLYLMHIKGLVEHASTKERSQHQLAFVNLEKSCCEVFTFLDHTFLFVFFLRITQYIGDTHNAHTLIPMNTRTQTLPLGASSKTAGKSSRLTKSPQMPYLSICCLLW